MWWRNFESGSRKRHLLVSGIRSLVTNSIGIADNELVVQCCKCQSIKVLGSRLPACLFAALIPRNVYESCEKGKSNIEWTLERSRSITKLKWRLILFERLLPVAATSLHPYSLTHTHLRYINDMNENEIVSLSRPLALALPLLHHPHTLTRMTSKLWFTKREQMRERAKWE